jgi:hypothetical protein
MEQTENKVIKSTLNSRYFISALAIWFFTNLIGAALLLITPNLELLGSHELDSDAALIVMLFSGCMSVPAMLIQWGCFVFIKEKTISQVAKRAIIIVAGVVLAVLTLCVVHLVFDSLPIFLEIIPEYAIAAGIGGWAGTFYYPTPLRSYNLGIDEEQSQT